MLETPGPMQRIVLEVLAIALAEGSELTGKQIADAGKFFSEGSVYGCTSGMVNFHKRHWIRYRYIGDKRHWRITANGMAALLKYYRKEGSPC